MTVAVWQFYPDKTENYAYVNNLLTPEECAQIIDIGNTKLIEATVDGKNNGVRESQISWLFPNDLEFAFRRVTDAVVHVNNQFFNFDLFGFAEGFQFTRYDAPTGHYGMHIDKTSNGAVRKLSLTIQLSSPDDYKGGELVLQFKKDAEIMPKELGKMVVFPSYVLHEVRPVTKGTRYSLVAWITGKPFK
jgi:predicted 2-oxoglutarate/Fe(II)-dependent dioxygenase YbiX